MYLMLKIRKSIELGRILGPMVLVLVFYESSISRETWTQLMKDLCFNACFFNCMWTLVAWKGIYLVGNLDDSWHSYKSVHLLYFRRLVQDILSVESSLDSLQPKPQEIVNPQLDSVCDGGAGCCWNTIKRTSKQPGPNHTLKLFQGPLNNALNSQLLGEAFCK